MMKSWLTVLFVALAAGAWTWPKSTSVAAAEQGAPLVQIVPPGEKLVGNPSEKGALYYALEGQTTKLTTRFKSGHVAVAERSRIGNVTTTLRDEGGNEVARLRVNRIDGAHDLLHYQSRDAAPFQAMSNPNVVKPTLDWSAKQAYHLNKGGTDNLVWDEGTMRSRAKARIDTEAEVTGVETEWAEGLSANVTRQVYEPRNIAGHTIGGPVLVSDLKQHGTSVGWAIWFEKDRAFAYHIPQLMPRGPDVIFESDLMQAYGTGWPFKPDTAWINLQVIATHHLKTLVAKNGSTNVVAKNCTDKVAPTGVAKVMEFFAPSLLANEVGCDYLHRLDGGVVRDCCDDHDLCYSKARGGCDITSWWLFWKSWACDNCNMSAVVCFVINGGASPTDCLRPRLNPACGGG
jgi:hypothetical protein